VDGAGAALLRGLVRRRRRAGHQGAVGAADGDVQQQHGAVRGRRRQQEIPSHVGGILVFLLVIGEQLNGEDDRDRVADDRAAACCIIINYASAGALLLLPLRYLLTTVTEVVSIVLNCQQCNFFFSLLGVLVHVE